MKKASDITNILIVGVGGQGILLSADILAEVLMAQHLDVTEAEIHGMSQRGGSVHSMIRYGKDIASPLIVEGEADYLLAYEELEALRWASYARPDAEVIVNTQEIPPVPVALGVAEYPADPPAQLRRHFRHVTSVSAIDLAGRAGDKRAANIAILGVLAKRLPFDQDTWVEGIARRVPPKTLEVNKQAFLLGWGL